LIKDWLPQSVTSVFTADAADVPTLKDRKHRLAMKIEKLFGRDITTNIISWSGSPLPGVSPWLISSFNSLPFPHAGIFLQERFRTPKCSGN
jgi:hypothetical protein